MEVTGGWGLLETLYPVIVLFHGLAFPKFSDGSVMTVEFVRGRVDGGLLADCWGVAKLTWFDVGCWDNSLSKSICRQTFKIRLDPPVGLCTIWSSGSLT